MRWTLTVLPIFLTFTASHSALGQDNDNLEWCKAACAVAPANAPPPGCNCELLDLPDPSSGLSQTPPVETPPVEAKPEELHSEPTQASCALECTENPLAAPAECDCANAALPGGGAGGSYGGITPESIDEDGVIEVRELLDYMEQLYRFRLEGIDHFYFFERMVVATGEQAENTPPWASYLANSEASPASPPDAAEGINTVAPVARNFKVTHEQGRPKVKPATRVDVNEYRVKNDPALAQFATADEKAAAEALATNPALLLEALAGLAGPQLGAELAEAAGEVRATLAQDEEDAKENFSEDVLGELLGLKQALDESDKFDKEGQLWAGYYLISPGHNYMQFEKVTRCSSVDGCAVYEFHRSVIALLNTAAKWNNNPTGEPFSGRESGLSLIWQPPSEALKAFQLQNAKEAKINHAKSAELWLPIPPEIQNRVMANQKYGSTLEPPALPEEPDWYKELLKEYEQQAAEFLELEDTYFKDRPVRMRVLFESDSGFQAVDRVYADFRKAKTMYEPRLVREKFVLWACGTDIESWMEQDIEALLYSSAVDQCENPRESLVERVRSRFTVNQGYSTAEEEAEAIFEELGELP